MLRKIKKLGKKIAKPFVKLVNAVKATVQAIKARVQMAKVQLTARVTMAVAGTAAESYVDTGVKILIAVVIGALLMAGLYALFKFQKGQTINSHGVAAVTAVSLLLYILYGTGMNLIKGVLLADLCLYASVSDIQTRKVTDAVPVMLFLLGLVNVSQAVLLCRTITALAFFGVFLLLAVVFKNKIGGADIKFISASMMLTGFTKGFVGLIAGLLLSVVGTLIRNKKTKSKDHTLPLIPYLSVGCMAALLIGGF